MKIPEFVKGTVIVSRDGKIEGTFTGTTRPCTLEGCRGLRHTVRWDDGKISYPCGKGLDYDPTMKRWFIM